MCETHGIMVFGTVSDPMNFLDRLDSVAKRIERFYPAAACRSALHHQPNLGQKVRFGLLVGTPVLALAVLDVAGAEQVLRSADLAGKAALVPKETAGEITAKVLPNVEKDFTTDYSRDVEVLEAAVGSGADHTLSGKIRNNTDHVVRVADIVFDVTDEDGSQLGGVAVRVENIAAERHCAVSRLASSSAAPARRWCAKSTHADGGAKNPTGSIATTFHLRPLLFQRASSRFRGGG